MLADHGPKQADPVAVNLKAVSPQSFWPSFHTTWLRAFRNNPEPEKVSGTFLQQ
jgi:hypothetical protein